MLSPLERLEITAACERLSLDYSHHADSAQLNEWSELFAEDGEMHLFGQIHKGRAAIRKSISVDAEMVTVHSIANVRIDVLGADEAQGSAYVTVFVGKKKDGKATAPTVAPILVGIYRDSYRRTDAGWKFARRIFEPLISRAQ